MIIVISVIIPTYNRAVLLRETLRFLSMQKAFTSIDLEVVVVDDGSDDNTRAVAEKYAPKFTKLVYRFRPRDAESCRSRARNLGIAAAQGDILVFLDCGVLVPPNFLSDVLATFVDRPDNVILPRVAGLFVSDVEAQKVDNDQLTPDNLYQITEELLDTSAGPGWGDSRDPLVFSVGGDLSLLPAPWVLAWTAAMIVPAATVRAVDGFDESFLNWGAEDTDFAYRLHKGGLSFYCNERILALHLPHLSEGDTDDKETSNQANVRKMHHRYRSFETEVFASYTSIHVNRVLTRILSSYGVPWLQSPGLAKAIAEHWPIPPAPSVIFGSDSSAFLRALPSTHVFCVNPFGCERLARVFPDRKVEHRLGTDTGYPDQFFTTALIMDFYRGYGTRILGPVLQEAVRISQEVLFCFSSKGKPFDRRSGEYYADLDEIELEARRRSLVFVEAFCYEDCQIWRVQRPSK